MSIFKRLSATLVSHIDHVVGEVENHDAVIQASLHEMRKRVAEANIRLNRVRAEEAQIEKRKQQRESDALRWRQRAIDSAKEDEEKALECLRRSRNCQQQAEKYNQALQQYQESANTLARDVEASEARLMEMKQKLTLMRARHSAASATNATSNDESDANHLLEETFDRWEVNISHSEMAVDNLAPVDAIELEFIDQEESQTLRVDLAELLAQAEEKQQ
ncbi:hypothetical protein MNBD_GAMMA26-156 [hydrothermal vent metagenome]|uniref:PspA/IM30 family protein n=1 Tax=hydrothermal vent metagenome TaxID=652676 RepID=A0A3B1BVJ0_9ZZZZ